MKQLSTEVKIIDGKPKKIHHVVVHRFSVGDVEDPDLYAGEPLYQWERSEMGQYIMSKALETPEWRRQVNYSTHGYEYAIIAKLYDEDMTYFMLRWL